MCALLYWQAPADSAVFMSIYPSLIVIFFIVCNYIILIPLQILLYPEKSIFWYIL